jgi:hypothetical protein
MQVHRGTFQHHENGGHGWSGAERRVNSSTIPNIADRLRDNYDRIWRSVTSCIKEMKLNLVDRAQWHKYSNYVHRTTGQALLHFNSFTT